MTRKLYEEPSVKSIADGIRRINGSNRKYKIGEMSKHIRSWAPETLEFTSDSIENYRIDMTNFNATKLKTVARLFSNLQIATQSIGQIFCKDNKIESSESMFDMGYNSSNFKLYSIEDNYYSTFYMPENTNANRMFYKTNLSSFAYTLYAPKLSSLKEMFRSTNLYATPSNFSDWELRKGYDASYMFADLEHLVSTNFGGTNKSYPGNVEGFFYNTTFTSMPYVDIPALDFSLCNNFKSMFENSKGVVNDIKIMNEIVTIPYGATFEKMFCNSNLQIRDYSFLRWFKVESADMKDMFKNVTGIEKIDIRRFDLFSAKNVYGLINATLNPNCKIYVGTETDAQVLRNGSETPELLNIVVVGR